MKTLQFKASAPELQLGWFRSRSSVIAAIVLPTFVSATLLPISAAAQRRPAGGSASALANGNYGPGRGAQPGSSVAPSSAALAGGAGRAAAANQHPTDRLRAGDNVNKQLASGVDLNRQGPRGNAPAAADVTATSLAKGGQDVSPQAISMPSGAATISGMGESFTAQGTTGVMTMTVPFALPAARGGTQASLGISYSSTGGAGLAGMGWGLAGHVFIVRQSDRGVPTYDDRSDFHPGQDRFIFGAQELVPICTVNAGSCSGAASGEIMPAWANGWQYFRARIEGAYLRFFWSPDHRTWRIQSKEGTNMELGVPLDGTSYAGGIETNPDRPSEIYRWSLVRQYDSHRASNTASPAPYNVILYRYLQDQGTAYLTDIYHTTPASAPSDHTLTKFAHHATLVYEARPDPTETYRAGWQMRQRLRLKRVDLASKRFGLGASAARELVRRYHLDYDADSHTSLLSHVQVEGRCGSPILESSEMLPFSNCPRLPRTTFEYQRVEGALQAAARDSQGFAFEPFNQRVNTVAGSPPHSLDESATTLFDVNSDGLQDVLVTAPGVFSGKHGVFFASAGTNGSIAFGPVQRMGVSGSTGADPSVLTMENPNIAPLDVNGDARLDLVHMPQLKRYAVYEPALQSGIWNWVGRDVLTASGQSPKIDFARDAGRIAVADVNSDGLVDVVFASATEMQTFFALGRYPGGDGQFGRATRTGPSTATLSNDPITSCVPWSGTPARIGDVGVSLGDMNGDGLPDLVRSRSGQVVYWPGRGNGFWGTGSRTDCAAGSFGENRHVQMTNAPQTLTAQPGGVRLGDVNGDGLDDLIEVRFNAVDVYLNDNGLGWTDRLTIGNVPTKPNGSNPVRVTDINGSGTPDILWGTAQDYRYVDLAGGKRPHLLRRVHNGLGKTTEFDYSTSTTLMLSAAAAGVPWASTMPLSVPVVVRITDRDNLDRIGRPAGVQTIEYGYRDPVFDGRQREFRGFRYAESRHLGDATGPTSITRSTFLLGECQVAQNGLDTCRTEQRWKDNWREALKGRPSLVETMDELGTYLSTQHYTYTLRQLYSGRDGRRVIAALPTRQDSFTYDTAAWTPGSTSVDMPEVLVELPDVTQTENRAVPKRSSAGTVRVRSTRQFDHFGNPTQSTNEGCVEGCTPTDEHITSTLAFQRPAGDSSGWLWRQVGSYVTGSSHPSPRHQLGTEYNAAGDATRATATLSGTLPLDRFHAAAGAVAPPPPDAAGGITSAVVVEMASYTRDEFGNLTGARSGPDRCRTVGFDDEYRALPVTETVFGGPRGASGCGQRQFTTAAQYDRGLGLVTTGSSITGQPARYEYDAFGRLSSKTFASTATPGSLASRPSATYEYLLPTDATVRPYSVVRVRTQDGVNQDAADVHEVVRLYDGSGQLLIVLTEADRSAGDTGSWIVSGWTNYNRRGAPVRSYLNWTYDGDPLAFSFAITPPARSSTQEYDAFGRPVAQYGSDGRLRLRVVHHAASRDIWDAEDLTAGFHQGTYASLFGDGHGRSTRLVERVRVGGTLEQREVINEYLPSGEVERITRRRAGSPDVVRWMRYDSLGRMVLNVEPNTSQGFNPNPSTAPSSIKAWRLAYNDAGQLVGTSDARGCGVNYHYDSAGRMTAEDYSPCRREHAAYSPPDFANGTGVEVLYRYDTADPEAGSIVDAAGRTFTINPSLLWGRSVSVSDMGAKGVARYDALGRLTGTASRVAKPGGSNALASRYAPRWYIQEAQLDAADRLVSTTTGATVPELMGANNESRVTFSYSRRGVLFGASSSYGTLVASNKYDADGAILETVLGDAAATTRTYGYDDLKRLRLVQTDRAAPELWSSPGYKPPTDATQQLSLEDLGFEYDAVGNVTRITDYRNGLDWPGSAKPRSRSFEYDDSYRLTRVVHEFASGSDPWTSPFAPENQNSSLSPRPQPHLSFAERLKEQRFQYDHLGNTTSTTDDQSGFYDRSLGVITNGSASAGPHQLLSASNRTVASTSPRKGDLSARYDVSGNLTDLIIRRDGTCLPAGSSCWQRFEYLWDELGQLATARRWDLRAAGPDERTANGTITAPVPPRAPDVELRYVYDAGGTRKLKTAVDPAANQSHAVYITPALELRSTWWAAQGTAAPDYVLTPATQTVLLPAAGAVARVIHSEYDMPSQSSGKQHVFLQLADQLGSTSFVIDRGTGELVEYAAYAAYGATDSNYRPARWGSVREPYKFAGKEEDIEVGLAYFGARYLSLGLNRWISPDPVTIHQRRSDPNPYAYVAGRPLAAVDPNGAELFTIIVVGIVVGAVLAGGTSAAVQYAANDGKVDWGWKGVAGAALAGAVGGGLTAGLGAVGAGVWAGAAGGAASSATSAAASGSSAGGVLVAAGLGALGGLAGSYLSGTVNGWSMQLLEPTGIALDVAVHISAATSSILTSTAMSLGATAIRDFGGGRVDYGHALGVGLANGASGYLGSAMSGSLPQPGKGHSTNEGALREAAYNNQSQLNGSGSVRETGAFTYEWGGRYYATRTMTSPNHESINPDEVLAESWVPEGATLSGFSHAHPPPSAVDRLVQQGKISGSYSEGKPYNFPNGFHPGDKTAIDGSWRSYSKGGPWAEAISSPQGTLEFYYPATGETRIQAPLRNLPSVQ